MQIDLETLGITKEEVITRLIGDLKEDIYDDCQKAVIKEIKDQALVKITAAVDKEVHDMIRGTFEVAYTPVNNWGEPTGPKTTLRDLLFERTKAWWSQQVDSTGRPCASYSAKGTLAEWHAQQVVSKFIKENMKEGLEAMMGGLKSKMAIAITNQLAVALGTHIKQG